MPQYPYIIDIRFWSKVNVRKDPDQCWLWTASTAGGYGRIRYKGTTYRANRLAWELFNGEPMGDRQALHECDNKLCCNPHHIYAGTPSQNMIDRNVRNGRKSNKLDPEKVRLIRKWHKSGETNGDIARVFNMSRAAITKVTSGKTWAYVKD